MFHLDNNSGIDVMPAIKQALSHQSKWFTEGDTKTPPSHPGADWFNIVQAELLNILKEAGISPKKDALNQLSIAIRALVSKGRVQLSSAVDSTSETEAATSKAVRDAFNYAKFSDEKAQAAYNQAEMALRAAEARATTISVGRVQLSSAVDSTSETEAATPLAVKLARDLAGQAQWHANHNAVQKTQKINGKKLDADISLSAADVGALSIFDFNTMVGNPGFEMTPKGLIRQWGTVQLPPVGDYNSVVIGGTKYYTNYYQISLPIAFPHNSDTVNVTMACSTIEVQSSMFGTFVTANLSGSPSRLTLAVTTPVLGAALTIHYEIIGH
ncbi:hypothetical protein A9G45_09610 [Gilliamella sp. HK2]|uniref:phage tail protein n=1 Tax=Gilliamella sp. HK2 TaxID=3120246 RepID=UPI00080DCDC5|nr:phage tail protein [Gilliamella apicola]OCG27177.1 hypothetical protein A9G45_09610 [Gilliamella apicola]OCG29269.1 hypothetical protein A9G46_00880 [Gilliamella apicola]